MYTAGTQLPHCLHQKCRRTVARWPHKRRQKLDVVSYGEMTPDPPKIEKNKFVLKCILGHFQCFEPMFFLGKVSKKKIVEFFTKKYIGSKYWKWPKMHFKTNLFFSILWGVGGHFIITDHLKLLSSLLRLPCNCSPTYIIQNPFHYVQIIFSQ